MLTITVVFQFHPFEGTVKFFRGYKLCDFAIGWIQMSSFKPDIKVICRLPWYTEDRNPCVSAEDIGLGRLHMLWEAKACGPQPLKPERSRACNPQLTSPALQPLKPCIQSLCSAPQGEACAPKRRSASHENVQNHRLLQKFKSKRQRDITSHWSEWLSPKKSTNKKCWRGCGETEILLHCW